MSLCGGALEKPLAWRKAEANCYTSVYIIELNCNVITLRETKENAQTTFHCSHVTNELCQVPENTLLNHWDKVNADESEDVTFKQLIHAVKLFGLSANRWFGSRREARHIVQKHSATALHSQARGALGCQTAAVASKTFCSVFGRRRDKRDDGTPNMVASMALA